MVEEQKNLHGKKVVNKDYLLIKYEGPSFENQMELHAFIKQITSVKEVLKETIYQLNKTRKIEDDPKEPQFYLQLRKGSFETALLIVFSHPILINVVSDCIASYLKYLVTGARNKKYTQEITSLSDSQNIRNATREIISPCLQDNDQATIINGDVNITKNITKVYILDKPKRDSITQTLQRIESDVPTKKVEQEMYGKILKVNAVKAEDQLSRSKFGFVIEGGNKPVETSFNKEVSEKDLKNILFERVKIKAMVFYKGEDIIKIIISSYTLSPLKTLTDY